MYDWDDLRYFLALHRAGSLADAADLVRADPTTVSRRIGALGATLALYGQITVEKGAVVQSNFRDYRLLRLPEAPSAIHIELVGGEHAPGGVGEPGVPPVAPAITNAWFALTGERQRRLPFRPGVLPV